MLDQALKEFIEEQLASLGPVTVRRMFGGGGIFLDGLMFGLIIDDRLYFKVDDANRPAFEAEGQQPFAYAKSNGRTTVMSFWTAPERLLDEPDDLVAWARGAWAVARRAKSKARKTPKRRSR